MRHASYIAPFASREVGRLQPCPESIGAVLDERIDGVKLCLVAFSFRLGPRVISPGFV